MCSKKMIFLFLVVTAIMSKETAMAASDDFEYYLGFYTDYRYPYAVQEEERITKEQAAHEGSYVLVKRDEKNRIVTIIKVIKKKCFFHHEYRYKKNGNLASGERISCRDKPISEHLEDFYSDDPSRRPKGEFLQLPRSKFKK